jgi:hypothetical protein
VAAKADKIQSKKILEVDHWLMKPVVKFRTVYLDLYLGDVTAFGPASAYDQEWFEKVKLVYADSPYDLKPWGKEVLSYDLVPWSEKEVGEWFNICFFLNTLCYSNRLFLVIVVTSHYVVTSCRALRQYDEFLLHLQFKACYQAWPTSWSLQASSRRLK